MKKPYFWLITALVIILLVFPKNDTYSDGYGAISPISTIQQYAEMRVTETWDESQWESFNNIISQESLHWKVTTEHYPDRQDYSTAYGLAGFLDGTWDDVGCVKTDSEIVQINCEIKYIQQRYGTPEEAWKFHLRKNWY